MSSNVKTINELRDSRIMFDKNPPEFGFFIIIISLIFVSSAIVWSIKTPKNYIGIYKNQ